MFKFNIIFYYYFREKRNYIKVRTKSYFNIVYTRIAKILRPFFLRVRIIFLPCVVLIRARKPDKRKME